MYSRVDLILFFKLNKSLKDLEKKGKFFKKKKSSKPIDASFM